MTTASPAALAPLVQAWPEPVLLVARDGALLAWNDPARRLLRLDVVPAAGAPVAAAIGGAAAAALLASPASSPEFVIGDEGTPFGASMVRAVAVRLAGGGLLLRLSDASEEHRLRAHLEQAERLASIGEMLSSVAHELANPLTAVLGYADLLLADPDDRVPRPEIERIRAEAMRCRRIVSNLLDLARADSLDMKPLLAAQVLDKVAEFRGYATTVGRIEIAREVEDGLPPVNGDLHRLVQAVLNLVTNAEDAVRSRPDGRRIVLRARSVPSGVAIDVEDNGPGVPESIREIVFEPFFTTKPRGRGTGLGLSLVRATARAHGGSVRVDAAPGGGALFTIEIPAIATA